MVFQFTGFSVILSLSAFVSASCAGPPAHSQWEPIPELTDEFEGDALDTSKWHDHNPTWKGRQPAYFHPRNITVRDGKLHLTMRHENLEGLPEGYHTYTSAAVQSKTLVKYGYFEIKCRPMRSSGSSAFWFYNNEPDWWTEIDVFEMGAGAPGHERTVHTNAHVMHTPTDKEHRENGGRWEAPYDLADAYHVYALEWNEQELKYYVDGKVIRRLENTHWHQALTLNFDSETMPDWFGLPKEEDLPSTFSIEYVRSWRQINRTEGE